MARSRKINRAAFQGGIQKIIIQNITEIIMFNKDEEWLSTNFTQKPFGCAYDLSAMKHGNPKHQGVPEDAASWLRRQYLA